MDSKRKCIQTRDLWKQSRGFACRWCTARLLRWGRAPPVS